jgi:mediator of RNA polymerase II transcription subunit 12, fungi type
MPSRVTLNDSKRQAWFTDLADPNVPLHKLGKNVPHGAKGHDLLDLLQSNNVAIPRAVWFLRVFGANETVRRLSNFSSCLIAFNQVENILGRPAEQTVLQSDAVQRRLGERRHQLLKETISRHRTAKRPPRRLEHQTDVQGCPRGWRFTCTLDLAFYILVRYILVFIILFSISS